MATLRTRKEFSPHATAAVITAPGDSSEIYLSLEVWKCEP
jgi:hypothetical protein